MPGAGRKGSGRHPPESMPILALISLSLFQQDASAVDPFRSGDCRSCHVPDAVQVTQGHDPFRHGNCQVCHVLPQDAPSGPDLLDQPLPGAPPAGSFVAANQDFGGSFATRHLTTHVPFSGSKSRGATTAPASPDFGSRHRLLHQDPEATTGRAFAVAPELLDGADFVWVRESGGKWHKVPLEAGAAGLVPSEPDVEVDAELRPSALGGVALLELRSDSPVAAVVALPGHRNSSRPVSFTNDLTIRVPLGAERPDRLPLEIHTPDGRRRMLDVNLADASARVAEQPLAARAFLVAGSPRSGMLELWTPHPRRLEVRAPAEGETALDIPELAPRRSTAAAKSRPTSLVPRTGRPGGGLELDMHATNAPVEYAGLTACLQCHPKAADHGASHPLVRVRNGGDYAVPETLPLGEGGRMLCNTCHDPHGGSEYRQHMRMDPDRELCIQCHVQVR